jgi:hypothetical protein
MIAAMPIGGQDVFIVGAARTPIGRYGGGLRDVHPPRRHGRRCREAA